MQNITDTFLSLVRIGSESKHEKTFVEHLRQVLTALGAETWIDNVNEKTGGEIGNLFARFPGHVSKPPVLFCSHMDTVTPGKTVNPRIDGEWIVSDGSSVLGADDKSGIAEILYGIEYARQSGQPLAPIELFFTISEEIGLLGSKFGDISKLQAKMGYALDGHHIGDVMIGAPSANTIDIQVFGKAAHAGVEPEKGVSAIVVAAKAISKLQIGRIDHETTCNLGIIEGGRATNIVTDEVRIHGEARSHDPKKLQEVTDRIKNTFEQTAAEFKLGDFTAHAEVIVHREYEAFYQPETAPVSRLAIEAAKKAGIECSAERGGGGSDANNINPQGIAMIVLGTGMDQYHTCSEHIRVSDLERGARWVEQIIRLYSTEA